MRKLHNSFYHWANYKLSTKKLSLYLNYFLDILNVNNLATENSLKSWLKEILCGILKMGFPYEI